MESPLFCSGLMGVDDDDDDGCLLQMTELKASQFTIAQELRQKMKNASRDFDGKIDLLQKKIREQSREIALLNRGKKKGDKSAMLSATDGGSSGTDSPSVG